MGGGSYSYCASHERSRGFAASVKNCSKVVMDSLSDSDFSAAMRGTTTSEYQKIFTSRSLDSEMNISGKVRESCDSEEHPNSFPIIIGLDVTGSMSSIPGDLITQAFPEIMKGIMEAGVEHAQICFVGIGDDIYDDAPIQVGQFETSDDLTEKWLKKIYLESGGGGNDGESYGLCWYFAARHTKIDSFEKRGKKGCLITIGDEPILAKHSKHSINALFGDTLQGDVYIDDLYDEVSEKWDVWHVDAGRNGKLRWDKVVNNNHFVKAGRDVNSIAKAIRDCIITSYNSSKVSQPAENVENNSENLTMFV